MKTFWLFRTNLRPFEYYHKYTNLVEFKKKCHDFYLLQGIWFLENDIFDEVVIWRLAPQKGSYREEIIFKISGKRFIQRFVHKFEDCFTYSPHPTVTFFRGGFPEYGKLTRMQPAFFGLKLYCGTGQRVRPQHAGIYNKILVEDARDFGEGTIPFYKTANQQIFKPLALEQKYDICWPCNFSQLSYKGQEFFIKAIGASSFLKKLKILHVGNKPKIGQELCKKHGVSNIDFAGYVSRPDLNSLLNYSKFGLVTSNQSDGSPRVITEILCSGISLLIRNTTRILCYELFNIFAFTDVIVRPVIKKALKGRDDPKKGIQATLVTLSMANTCKKNLTQWGII